MPVRANLTVNDGQATPAAHTFAVNGDKGAVASFVDKTSGIPIGFIELGHEVRFAKSVGAANSVLMSVNLPTLGTVNGVTQKVRNSSALVRFNFAQDSTDQERKDLVAYVINGLGNATIRPSLYNIEPYYG
jgi:hypothetical protein